MKAFVKKNFLGLMLLSGAALFTACSGSGDSTSVEPESNDLLDFVAVADTEWDTETTIGSFKYKFDVNLTKDNKLTFNAKCTQHVESNSGNGQSGFGLAKRAEEPNSGTSESAQQTSYDLEAMDFSFTGTWTLETGYEYTLKFNDTDNSTIHVDYNKTEGRHEFYYIVKKGSDASSTVLFQAKDSAFRKTLKSDYQTWDLKDSKYTFTAETTGNNSSLAYAYLYCHNDGSAVYNTASGAGRAITVGLKWEIKDGDFILSEGNTKYYGDTSINAAKPGYRVSYSSLSFYCSTNSSVAWDSFTSKDFEGDAIYTFKGIDQGKEADCYLNSANKMFLYFDGSLENKGSYTFENETFTFNFVNGDRKVVSKATDGSYSFVFTKEVSESSSSTTYHVTLTYTPTGE